MEYVTLVLGALALVITFNAINIVPQGYEYTVERLGRYTRTLSPGLAFLLPVVDRVGQKQNMMERVLDVDSQEVITKDNAVVRVDGVVFFQIIDAKQASYEVNHLEHAILNIVMTNIRTVLGGMDLDESLSKRDEINAKLITIVDPAMLKWGAKCNRIEIKDVQPSEEMVASMARQMTAERLKRAQILESEGFKQSEILKAEGENKAVILKAEADRRATILDAEGRKAAAILDAEARERGAEAEAKATAMVSKAISEGDTNAINYFIATKYTDALQTIGSAENQKVLMLPLDATALMGSLAGIGEIAKEAFAKSSAKSSARPPA